VSAREQCHLADREQLEDGEPAQPWNTAYAARNRSMCKASEHLVECMSRSFRIVGLRYFQHMDTPERLVTFRPRTIVSVSAILVGIAAALWVVWVSRHVISWILVSLFLALAINPAVEALQRRGVRRRGAAAGLIYLMVVLAVAALLAAFLPSLINQVNDFVNAVPGYVRDLTHGKGPFGFLETKYHVVERAQDLVNGKGGAKVSGGFGAVVDVTKTLATGVAGVITIIFMTFFMLLEGPTWVDRAYGLIPADQQDRWHRVGHRIYQTVGGYVTGNLLISFVAATTSTFVLLIMGVPFPFALGLLVFILDLIPLAGATIAAVILVLVALSHSVVAAIVVGVFFVLYQQLENHLLQPLVYGRTVQLSPLVVLIAVLIGAEVAGILGALGAIPIAGSLQVILIDWLEHRRQARSAVLETPATEPQPV
jgi:predicted PurR-regulated permease PerM